jgi:alkylhydroperoxidase/carboxymuconolactone decarboxylase family protein YurZ
MTRDPSQSTGSAGVPLPSTADQMAKEHPDLWAAFQSLGEQASLAGTLDARTRRLVHLALAIASESQGATHSHVRRALSEGLTPEELEHVALLAITTLGWSRAMKGLNWVRDITRLR